MLLRFLDRLRADISVGPAWVGRAIGQWMLDIFLPDRDRYISPAIPRNAAELRNTFPVASRAQARAAAGVMRDLDRARAQLQERDQAAAQLNAYLHRNPDVMRLWLEGWPGNPPGPVR